MKWIIRLLLFAVIGGLIYGFYLRQTDYSGGEKIIGLSVLVLCLLLMPLFIYHRYRHKDLSHMTFKGFNTDNRDDEAKKN